MKKTITVFMRPGSQWNPDKSVRKQAFWDDHARFMDLLFEAGEVILAGAYADGTGSMAILAPENVEAARAVFQEDPWTLHDILLADEAKEWTLFLDERNKR